MQYPAARVAIKCPAVKVVSVTESAAGGMLPQLISSGQQAFTPIVKQTMYSKVNEKHESIFCCLTNVEVKQQNCQAKTHVSNTANC